MLFSLIVPICNSEKYLRRCLKSILEQTYSDFEVIAIDDGSTDGSLEILKEFANVDSRIKVFDYENGEVTRARQRGAFHAKGDYIISVDSDDTINRDLLLNLYNVILTYPEVDMVRFKVNLVNVYPGLDKELYNMNDLDMHNLVSGIEALKLWTIPFKKNDVFWMYAIKRENMQLIHISPDLKTNGDLAIVLLLIAKSNKVAMCDYVGYNFTCDNLSSLTHAFDINSMRKRSLDFLTAYIFVKREFRKLEVEYSQSFRYLQDNLDERLFRRYNSLDVSLQEELRSHFFNAINS